MAAIVPSGVPSAEALARETWLGRQRLLGEEHRDTISSLTIYTHTLADLKKLGEAERYQRKILELQERVLNVHSFLNKYGPHFVDWIYNAIDLDDKGHRVIRL